MSLERLLEIIAHDERCKLLAPSSHVTSSFQLPSDLQVFYQECNGVELFRESDYPYRILGIEELQSINQLLIGEPCLEDRSAKWVSIAEDFNGDYLSLDLSQKRLGWCYDSFHETHGLAGDTPVIAKSFTELLTRLYDSEGGSFYWFEQDFAGLYCDAYDDEK